MNHGFIRVATAVPELRVADCQFNSSKIFELIEQAEQESTEIVLFPELAMTAYTCGDLFFQEQLLQDAAHYLKELLLKSYSYHVVFIVGMPLRVNNRLYNVAVVAQSGEILGIVPKSYLSNSQEFNEFRWFTSGKSPTTQIVNINGSNVPFGTNLLFAYGNTQFAIEICKDLCVPTPPSNQHAMQGADIIFNLSASNELVGKQKSRQKIIEVQSTKLKCAYVYTSAGFGESSTDLVFSGSSFIVENGQVLKANENRFSLEAQLLITEIDYQRLQSDRRKDPSFFEAKTDANYQTVPCKSSNYQFVNLHRVIKKHPFIPSATNQDEYFKELLNIQVNALAQRWKHTHAETLLLGISGGLDSTWALMVCVATADKLGYDRKRIAGISMPGFGTTGRSQSNAKQLMDLLGIESMEISIREACLQHFKDIGHNPDIQDITYENVQARERTQVLMDMANKLNGLVIGTGDLSESALGWSTYNGDHMSMYAVNSSVPKTLIRPLLAWHAQVFEEQLQTIIADIIAAPISPELLPPNQQDETTQITEDTVGPYELHDFFLYYFIRHSFTPEKIKFLAMQAFGNEYTETTISKWLKVFLKRFFSQQFKRSCMPDGPKISSVNLSPRTDWKMPSDATGFEFD